MAPLSDSINSEFTSWPISLPLFKLSYCTTLTPRSPMTWTHLPNRDGMFAVFDQITKKSLDDVIVKKTLLKCVRGAELIDYIDFDILQHQVRSDEMRAESRQLRDEDRNVIVLLKTPYLALRYQLPDGQIRKIQMNFLPDSGCEVAVSILRKIGVPIRDKSLQPQAVATRPHSSQGVLPKSMWHQDQDPPNALLTGNRKTTSAPQQPQLPSQTTSVKPSSSQRGSQQQLSTSNNAPCGSVPVSSDPPGITSRPTSASNWAFQDQFNRPITFIHDPRTQLERSSSAHITSCATITRPYSSSAIFGSSSRPELPTSLEQRLLPSPELSNQQSALSYEARPTSAPQTRVWTERLFTDNVPLSQMLPPKRVLPFPEVKEKPRSRDDGPRIPATEDVDTAKSKKVKGRAIKQAKDRETTGKAKSSRRKASLPTPEPSSSAPKTRAKKIAIAKKDSDNALPSSAPPRITSSVKASSREVSPISEMLNQPSPPAVKLSKKRPLTLLNDKESNKRLRQAPDKTSSPSTERQKGPLDSTFSDLRPSELLDSLDGWIRKFKHMPAPERPKTSKEHLAEYAKQSDAERAKAIDNLICDCLQDENFGKLVEDVEGAWRRIGVGF